MWNIEINALYALYETEWKYVKTCKQWKYECDIKQIGHLSLINDLNQNSDEQMKYRKRNEYTNFILQFVLCIRQWRLYAYLKNICLKRHDIERLMFNISDKTFLSITGRGEDLWFA